MPTNQPAATSIRSRFGVYGVFLERGRVMTVRRGAGDDAGLLDLPGGAPEGTELFGETLARVLAADTGGRAVATGPWESFDVHVAQTGAGPRSARHETGVWCTVLLADARDGAPPPAGAPTIEWTPVFGWDDRTDLTAGLRAVLDAICL